MDTIVAQTADATSAMGSMRASVLPRTGRVTSDLAIGRRVRGSVRSVRQRLARDPSSGTVAQVVLLVGDAVYGARALAPVLRSR